MSVYYAQEDKFVEHVFGLILFGSDVDYFPVGIKMYVIYICTYQAAY